MRSVHGSRLCVIQHSLCLCAHLNNRVGGWFCVFFRYGHKTESSEQLMGIGAGRNPRRVWDTQKQPLMLNNIGLFQRDVGGGGGEASVVGTSGSFRGELRIEIECIVRSSCSWFEGRVNLPTEEFLLEIQEEMKNVRRGWNDKRMTTCYLKETLAFQSIVLKN